jgi:hypothetical protein
LPRRCAARRSAAQGSRNDANLRKCPERTLGLVTTALLTGRDMRRRSNQALVGVRNRYPSFISSSFFAGAIKSQSPASGNDNSAAQSTVVRLDVPEGNQSTNFHFACASPIQASPVIRAGVSSQKYFSGINPSHQRNSLFRFGLRISRETRNSNSVQKRRSTSSSSIDTGPDLPTYLC